MTRLHNLALVGLSLGCGEASDSGTSGAVGQSTGANVKFDIPSASSSSASPASSTGDGGCTETVEGDLEVTDASDFEWLQTVREIRGTLTISDLTGHEDLGFLACLQVVDGMTVQDTTSLRSFEGLGGVTELRDLTVQRNDALETLKGLDSIETITSAWIRDNPELSRLELNSLRSMHFFRLGWYECDGHGPTATAIPRGDNPKLTRIDGLEQFEEPEVRFVIEGQSGFVSANEITELALRIAPGGGIDAPSGTFHLNPNLAEEEIRAIYEAAGVPDIVLSPAVACENRDDDRKCPCDAGA